MMYLSVGTSKKIAKVSIWRENGGFAYLSKIRLIDEQGNYLIDYALRDRPGQWITQDIPDGKEIIGLRCNLNKAGDAPNSNCILKLGFLLWTPNPYAK